MGLGPEIVKNVSGGDANYTPKKQYLTLGPKFPKQCLHLGVLAANNALEMIAEIRRLGADEKCC